MHLINFQSRHGPIDNKDLMDFAVIPTPLCRRGSSYERESDEIPRNNFAAGCPRATSRLRIGTSTRKNYSEVSQRRQTSFTLKSTAKLDDFEFFRRTSAVQPLFRTENGVTCPFREPG